MTHYENKSSGVAEVESDANSFASPKCSNVTGRKVLRAGMGEGMDVKNGTPTQSLPELSEEWDRNRKELYDGIGKISGD